ncbi:MAG: hypothetical protein ACE5LU_25650 [Anaerolineae bacterium]
MTVQIEQGRLPITGIRHQRVGLHQAEGVAGGLGESPPADPDRDVQPATVVVGVRLSTLEERFGLGDEGVANLPLPGRVGIRPGRIDVGPTGLPLLMGICTRRQVPSSTPLSV